jgi:uncharacterized membrane protein
LGGCLTTGFEMIEHAATPSTGGQNTNLAVALLVHYGVGLFWLFVLGTIVGALFRLVSGAAVSGEVVIGVVWALCATPAWIVDSVRMTRARRELGRVWGVTFRWWAKSLVAPLSLVLEVRNWRRGDESKPARTAEPRPSPRAPVPPPAATPSPEPENPGPEVSGVMRTLEDLARRLGALELEVADLRRSVAAAPKQPAAPELPTAPVVPPTPMRLERPAAPTRPPLPPPPRTPNAAEPPWWSGLTFADLFSAKALAWMGGVVTLLGIVFFFVLAVNRGWIGPVARVTLGAVASSVVFAGGLYLHRRFGRVYSAYGAVGAGIAGGYATLLAATLLYDLISDWAALLVAAAIAGIAVAAALSWSSELVAGLGLVGATLAPAAVGLQNGELTAAGTTFTALVFAGTAVVAVQRNWQLLLMAGVAASLPQAAVLVGQAHPTEWGIVAVAGAFWLLYLAAAIARQTRLRTADLAPFPATLVLVGGSFVGSAGSALFTGSGQGWALVTIAAVYAAAAAVLFQRSRDRDLCALLAVVGLAIFAFGLADLLSGPALAIAWAAEAAVLAWLARRIGEFRYQLASLAYLAAALLHALALDAPLRQLCQASGHPASGALAFVGVALAGGVVAYYCRPWAAPKLSAGILRPLQPTLTSFRESQGLWRSITGWTAALAGLYAVSLGVLGIAQWSSQGQVERAFEWGQVAVAGLWGLAALAVLYAGLKRSWEEFRAAGLIWLAATLAQAVVFFSGWLSGSPRAFGFLAVSAALLAGALVDRLRRIDRAIFPAIVLYAVSSLGLAFAGLVLLVHGRAAEGLALLALAGLYCSTAALVFGRDRDLATVLWAPALLVGSFALAEALGGTWLVLAWTATAVALAAIADRTAERRLQLAALAYAGLAALHVLSLDAPPGDFFGASRHPESGVPAVLLVVLGAASLALLARVGRERDDRDAVDLAVEQRQQLWQRSCIAVATVLGLYAVSLSILGLAEVIGTGSIAARFHGGHAAVSAVWGLLGLVALYTGLRKGLGWLQALGFGLFAISLAKIFLYDLTFLSSITRALSFLAVGAVLLLGGFFVQKLGAQHRDTRAA